MADKKIDEVTADSTIGGGEKFPIDDGGVAKYATIAQVKDYVLAQIAGQTAATGVDASADGVYLLKGGVVKPVAASVLAAAVLDYGFGLAGISEISGNELITLKDATVKKTVTTEALANWLEANIEVTPDYALADMTAAGTLGDSDLVLVAQAAGPRKVTLATLKEYALGKLAAYVVALTAAQSVGNSDTLLLVQGGTAKKVTVAQIISAVGGGCVTGPDSTTENKVPQWDSTAKKLKDGLTVTNSISSNPSNTKLPTEAAVKAAIGESGDVKGPLSTTANKIPQWDSTAKTLKDGKSVVTTLGSTGSDDNIPTEKAVRDAIDATNGVGATTLTTENNIPQWDSTQKKLKNGKGVSTSIPSSASASHDKIPTEKAVRDAVDGLITAPSSHTENAIPQWGAANELKPGKSVVTTLGSTGSDDNIPTEKAVRDAIQPATTSKDGLMTAADKTKLDGLADTGSVAEIGQDLADNDTIIVKKNDSVYRKSLLSRFWTYILGKLPTVRIDQFSPCQDNTNADASTSAHGLLKKLDGNTGHFLRGDGAWETPPGSSDFTGDSGSGGEHGLVPAPASGDAAGNKFLNANGSWTTPPSAAGVDIPGSTALDSLASDDALYVYDASSGEYKRVSGAQIASFINGLTRYETIFIPAGAFAPSTVDGAAMSALRFTNNTHDVAAFPADEDTFAEFNVQMPDDWNGLPVKAKVHWTCNSAQAENGQTAVFTLGAVAFDDGDAITDEPTAPVSIEDAMLAANELHVSGASDAITPDGEGNFLHFKIGRDVSEGTLTQSVQVLGVTIQFGRTSDAEQW